MIETITACENICRDFSWVGPFTEWLRNLAIVVGVWVAYYQLNAWRREHLSKRVAETAELLLSKAMNVKLAISSVRAAMENIPNDVENSEQAVIDIKRQRLQSYKDDFDRLRELQVLHQALVGTVEVKNAIDELFDVRQELYAALATLSGWKLGLVPNDEHLKLREKLMRDIYPMGKYDELGPRVKKAVETLEEHLLPEIRMERKK